MGKTIKYGMEVYKQSLTVPYATGTIISNTSLDITTSKMSNELNQLNGTENE